MNGVEKKTFGVGSAVIAAALLMAGGPAYAITACPADDPLSSIATPGFTCQISDKIFSDFTFSTDLATHVLFAVNPHTGDVVVTFSRDGQNTYPDGTNTFDYKVSVAPTAPPGTLIVMNTLGVDVSQPLVTTHAVITGNNSGSHTLSAINGATLVQVISPGDNSEMVMLTSDQAAGAQLNSISDDFAEKVHMVEAPEPASLSLLGLGLFGLGLARRRRS